MTPSPRVELTALTSLRGIAAVLVMFHHFMNVVLKDLMAAVPGLLILKSYLWVDLFFILSGFVLAYVYHASFQSGFSGPVYRRFMQARFARIYPLHLFMLALFVGYECLQWWLNAIGADGMRALEPPFTNGQSAPTLITNLLLVQTLHWRAYWNEPAWSISAEWIIYFTLPFVIFLLLRLRTHWLAGIAAVVVLPLVAIEWRFGDLGLYYAGWPMLVRCFCGATLGILVFRCYHQGLFRPMASARLTTPVLVLNLVILSIPGPGVLSVLGFAWLTLCAARLPQDQPHVLNGRLVLYLGKISYSLYLVHWLVVDIVRDGSLFATGLAPHEAFSPVVQLFLLVMMVAVVIAMSDLTFRYVEAPMRARFKPAGLTRPPRGSKVELK